MPTPQSGILPEANSQALFIITSIKAEKVPAEQLRRCCAAVPRLTGETAAMAPEARLASVIAVGSATWDHLYPDNRPSQLRPFRDRSEQGRMAPATPGDLLLHIRSERRDLNYLLARNIMEVFGDSLSLVEEVDAFRYLDSRDLTGFVDGTENPQGDERAQVALIGAEDSAFAGGSYISLQRYVHDLARWQALAVDRQESIIGRTKTDDVELDKETRPATAHISRVVIEQDGEELEILRHSMPYGNTREAGLLFIAYAKTPEIFDRMLDNMLFADSDGHYDHLMDYTRAVTGTAFFAPSLEFLES